MNKHVRRTARRAASLAAIVGFVMTAVPAAGQTPSADTSLRAVPLADIRLTDGFWAERQRINREHTVWANFEQCEKTGRIENFAQAARFINGDTSAVSRGLLFNDSDVYKMLEGAAYVLTTHPSPGSEEAVRLRAECDRVIRLIASAQHTDGYLNTYFTIKEPGKRWTNIVHGHELYCAGHLIEAGIAYHQATGERTLLDVAIRFADHIGTTFSPGKRAAAPGHQEIELALIKLRRHTGNDTYLNLARFFVEQRGRGIAAEGRPGRESSGEYSQDHLPVRDQDQIVGHAVRAAYFFCAVADLASISRDDGYIDAMHDVWNDLTHRKTYITGGIGPSAHNEGFTTPYDLPNDTAYAETCAGIASVMWNERLSRLHRDAGYFDAAERALYNGVLSGVSLSGDRFFYVNPLHSDGNHQRPEWYECACCPPNILRLVANVGTMFYSTSPGAGRGAIPPRPDDASARAGHAEGSRNLASGGLPEVFINLYGSGQAAISDAGLAIGQKTEYPWSGDVTVTIDPIDPKAAEARARLWARVPGWARSVEITSAGRRIPAQVVRGYALLGDSWSRGHTVTLSFPMPVERVTSHPMVESNVGRVALQRGPVVYCFESSDNDTPVHSAVLPPAAQTSFEFKPGLLTGVGVIRADMMTVQDEPSAWREELYRRVPALTPRTYTAIPYFAWANRGPSSMTVWVPEAASMLATRVIGPQVVTSSSAFRGERPENALDGSTPASSDDHNVPRVTFWPRKGTQEWIQVEFDRPRTVGSIGVYWFDDTGRGECRLPASWRVMYREATGSGLDTPADPQAIANAGAPENPGDADGAPSTDPNGPKDDWKEVPVMSTDSPYTVAKDQFCTVTFPRVRASAIRVEISLQQNVSGGVLEMKLGK
jgi:uncharacterized protein